MLLFALKLLYNYRTALAQHKDAKRPLKLVPKFD